MIQHVILRALKPGVTQQQIDEMRRRTERLAALDGIGPVVVGPNLSASPFTDGMTHVTVMIATSLEAIRQMIAHPLHAEAAAVAKAVSERVVIADIEMPES